jgi:type VI secretion system protein ImpJ
MFLKPQHFQQFDRWIENSLVRRVDGLAACTWGLRTLKYNPEALALGKLQITEAEVVFPDGTVYSVPSSQDPPGALSVKPEHRGSRIYLELPLRGHGGLEVSETGQTEQRYVRKTTQARDGSQSDGQVTEIVVGNLNVRISLEHELSDEMIALPVAEIESVGALGQVTLSETFIAPVLCLSASLRLMSITEQICGLLRNRATTLASRLASETGNSRSGIIDLVTLAAVNRYETLFGHFVALGQHAPELVYRECISLIGELSVHNVDVRRPPKLPLYDHGDLRATFDGLMQEIRKLLSVVVEQKAVNFPLEKREYGVWTGQISDRLVFQECRFVLIAQADMALEHVRTQLPNRIKIGPIEKIRELVNLQLPGIVVTPMPVAPREIPFVKNAVYFELERSNKLWPSFATSAAFALHVSGDNPGLGLELWAIK